MANSMHRTSQNYEWDEEYRLGGGAFATVYKGKHRETGQEVAVKVCLVSNCQGDNERLYIEDVQKLRDFDSPCILKYYANEEVDECNPWSPQRAIVMELADGSLRGELRKVENNLGLPHSTFFVLVIECLDALKYLDDRNLSHRDLKPENILVFRRYRQPLFKIGDFGLEHQLSKRNQSMHSNVGTFLYQPSCIHKAVANETDVSYTKDEFDLWSAACTFFEAATNLHPFLDMTASSLQTLVTFLESRPDDMVWCHYDAMKKQFISESEMPKQHSSYTGAFRNILAMYFKELFSKKKCFMELKGFSALTHEMLYIGLLRLLSPRQVMYEEWSWTRMYGNYEREDVWITQCTHRACGVHTKRDLMFDGIGALLELFEINSC